MNPLRLLGALVALALVALPVHADDEVDIPYHRFVLDNGLRLIVHVDDKAPIAAVNVWYHVGSKDEREGKTGFAHLFEHLMFNGSENHDEDWFKLMQRIGATDLNGTTNFDRTNYFQNVPTSALDTVLWMESDRMGHMLGAVTQEKLDEQRGVVQNEKRQGENQPYGQVWETVFRNLFPVGHPYSWGVIGYMEDLEAAELSDAHGWFEQYYGASNAVIVIAGDVDPDDVHQRVQRYFGHIPAGPPLPRHESWVPRRTDPQRITMQDRVPQARVYKYWAMPPSGSADADYLDLAASVLATGRNSRLYERLVYREQIATDVTAFAYGLEIAGIFAMFATVQPGGDVAAVERAMDEELARLLDRGVTRSELDRAKTGYRASFIRGVERIGGFGGKSDVLASGEVYFNNPHQYQERLARIAAATPQQVRDAARRWIASPSLVLEVQPFPQYSNTAAQVDRTSGPPRPDDYPSVDFPVPERAMLSNGLRVELVQRDAVPVVSMTLLVDAGYAADQHAAPGTANLTLDMLSEGTRRRTSLQISDQLQRLGANLSTGSNLDQSSVSMSALAENLDASLDLFADVILNPAFPEADFNRRRQQQIAGIQREQVTPVPMALRVFPRLLYGDDHAYSLPLTGSGTLESVRAMSIPDLQAFHSTWFKPNNATLVVVGDVSMAEMQPKLERLFRGWQPGEVPEKNIGPVAHREAAGVYIIDRPGSQQSIIFAGHIAPPKANEHEFALMTMNDVLGGTFTSRINMNLREDKGWAYGASSLLYSARGPRPFFAYAPVQSDRTADSMREIRNELTELLGDRPVTDDELSKSVDGRVLTLPGRWETGGAISGSLVESLRFGYPDDYWATYADNIRGLARDDLQQAANSVIRPDRLIWVVVGDRRSIEGPIRELGFGDIQYLDADGNPVD
ncbi:MAG: insulinase family protein [Xanthomonadaceae bacterium]|nr:insulinase family protein [Xanthomonadaceae bacterium]